MTPTPEQIAVWREDAIDLWLADTDALVGSKCENYTLGFLRSRTEQAAEIAALKAQIEHLKQVIIGDRIEWEDFPPASRLAFAQLLKG